MLLIKQYNDEREKLQKRMDNLIEMRADGEITKDLFMNKSEDIKKRLQIIDKELSQMKPEESKDSILYAREERLALFKSFLWQNIYNSNDGDIPEDIIRAFVSRIVVHEDTFDWYLRFIPENTFETLKPIGTRKNKTKITPFSLLQDRLRSATSDLTQSL